MNLVDTIRERIRHMPEGKSQGELARLLGVERSAVNRIGSGRRRIYAEEVPVICRYLGIDGAFDFPLPREQSSGLPVSGVVEAGAWRDVDSAASMHGTRNLPAYPSERHPPEFQYLLEVRGASMNRHYAEGEIAACVPLDREPLYDGRHVHVVRTDAAGRVEQTLKVYRERNGGAELHPDSDDPRWSEPLVIDDDPDATVEIRGVVIGSFRPAP